MDANDTISRIRPEARNSQQITVSKMPFRLGVKFQVLALVVLLGACSRKSEPRLEVWEGGVYQPRALSGFEITGKRDGATTRVVAMFTLESGERLRLELDVTYDPTPALGSGNWRIDGPQSGGGEAKAESIKFLGGQGEGPSLGGRFRLDEDGKPRFRVVLPLRPVGQPNWTVD
jgi:hypothetical protein